MAEWIHVVHWLSLRLTPSVCLVSGLPHFRLVTGMGIFSCFAASLFISYAVGYISCFWSCKCLPGGSAPFKVTFYYPLLVCVPISP